MSIVFSKRALYLKTYWYAHEFLVYAKKRGGPTSCVPSCLLHVYHLRHSFLKVMAKDMYQLRPVGSAPCVCHTETTKPANRTGCETATQRGTPHK